MIEFFAECFKIEVTPDRDTTVFFRRKAGQDLDCSACKGEGPSETCQNSVLKLDVPVLTTVNFNCSQPGDVFNVEINQDIGKNYVCFATTLNVDHSITIWF